MSWINSLATSLLFVFSPLILSEAFSQDLLNDNIQISGVTLHLKRYVPNVDGGSTGWAPLISMTSQPAATGNTDLFVSSQRGQVFAVSDNGGMGTVSTWFDYDAAVSQARTNASNGYTLEDPTGAHGGLRSVAFHPEFATNGKFYTSAMVDRPNRRNGQGSDFNYIGPSNAGFDGESVVAEWAYDFGASQVDPNSYRELFRISMPIYDHPVKQMTFNQYANPGDPDYGMLYIAHGDGSNQSTSAGDGRNPGDGRGKILRVNPLESGSNPYTTPGNPFNSDPNTLNEIYSMGHRNPHHISFARAANHSVHLIAAEGGRDNIEEVNLIQAGGSYGWSDREGTFVQNTDGGGYINGVSALPTNEWVNGYTYPSAQYDHDASPGAGFVGSIIGGGFVIDNDSDPALAGEYIFADFGGRSGNVYHTSLEDLVAAKTTLLANESPSLLTQAPISRLTLTLDLDGDEVIDRTADDLNSLLIVGRSDIRFGRGPIGEMFITSKQTGDLYLVTNTVPQPGGVLGDANGDGSFDFSDIEAFFQALSDLPAYVAQYPDVPIQLLDMNQDGNTDFGDIEAFFNALTG